METTDTAETKGFYTREPEGIFISFVRGENNSCWQIDKKVPTPLEHSNFEGHFIELKSYKSGRGKHQRFDLVLGHEGKRYHFIYWYKDHSATLTTLALFHHSLLTLKLFDKVEIWVKPGNTPRMILAGVIVNGDPLQWDNP